MSSNSKSSQEYIKTRDYKFSFKFYPDSTDYDINAVISKLQSYFQEWVWIKHDCDNHQYDKDSIRAFPLGGKRKVSGALHPCCRKYKPKLAKPHIHFYGRCDTHCKISIKQLVRYLRLPYSYNFRPHDIDFAHDWLACVKYTVHRNAPDKYQYDISKCVTNLRNLGDLIEGKNSMNEDLKILYEILEEAERNHEFIPYYELPRKMALRGCKLQYTKPSMVERISASFQHYRMGQDVQ